MRLIGISGAARAGKDTTANIIRTRHGFGVIAIADSMKRACRDIFQFTYEQLWGDDKELPDPRYRGLTPRRAMQLLGTEFGRACYENLWIDRAIEAAREVLAGNATYWPSMGLANFEAEEDLVPEGVVFSDVRFANERAAIEAAGGVVWRVTRIGAGLQGAAGAHASENELTDAMFRPDRIIVNNDTFKELAETVDRMMRELA